MAQTVKSQVGPFKVKGRLSEYNLEWRHNNPASSMCSIARCRSRRDGREFTITKQDIIIPDECPVLKVPFTYGTEYAMSLDRIDSSKGYIPGNVQVISRKANAMKQNATPSELVAFAEWALAEYGEDYSELQLHDQ